MKKIIKTLAVLSLVFGFAAILRTNESTIFMIDTVSAATDGSECMDEGWGQCAPGWKDKGYVYDADKGYYVPGKGGATTTPAVTTTKPVVTTTKPAETTKAPVTTTTKPATTVKGETTKKPDATTAPATTQAPEATTDAPVDATTAPEVTTQAPATTQAPVTTTKAPAKDETNSAVNIPLLGGIVVVIAIIGFFVFKKFSKKA